MLTGDRVYTRWKRLFSMINDLPTVYEAVSGKKLAKAFAASNKYKSNSKVQRSQEPQIKYPGTSQQKDEDEIVDEEDEDEHGDGLCGACGENYATEEFWIFCDICKRWFHGKCVKIIPARAEHIKQYKCPSCSNKRIRP